MEENDNIIRKLINATLLNKRLKSQLDNVKRGGKTSYIFIISAAVIFFGLLLIFPIKSSETVHYTDNSINKVNGEQTITFVSNVVEKHKPIVHLASMSIEEKHKLIAEAMVLFPEIFGNNYRHKYRRFNDWLINKSIQHHQAKSLFTAIGRGSLSVNQTIYDKIPGVLMTLDKHAILLLSALKNKTSAELSESWGVMVTDDFNTRFSVWSRLMLEQVRKTLKKHPFPVDSYIHGLIAR